MKVQRRPLLWAGLATVSLVLAFPPFDLAPMAWGAALGALLLGREIRGRQGLLLAILTPWVGTFLALFWISRVTWLGIFPLTLILSLYTALFLLGVSRVRGASYLSLALFPPCWWVALEWVRSWLFSGFPWLLLGYSQYRRPAIVGLSRWGGVYLVSFLIVFTASSLLYAWTFRRDRRRCALGLLGPACLWALTFIPLKAGEPGLFTAGLVQGNEGFDEKWEPAYQDDILMRQKDLTLGLDGPVDLVVWPETAVPAYLMEDPNLEAFASSIARDMNAYFLVGALRAEGQKSFNTAFLFSRTGAFLDSYDKIHLVPFGEYMPGAQRWPFLQEWFPEIGMETPGTEVKVFEIRERMHDRPVRVAAVICYEGIFPALCRRFIRQGAQCLINSTNEAWYGPGGMQRQHLAMYAFRAVENGVSVLRSANSGITCLITPSGRINSRVVVNGQETFVSGAITCDVPCPTGPTFYSRHGDLFVILATALSLTILTWKTVAFRDSLEGTESIGGG